MLFYNLKDCKQFQVALKTEVSDCTRLLGIHLPTLSEAQMIWYQTLGLINNESKVKWKEVAVTSFEVLAHHLPREAEKNHKTPQLDIGVWAKIKNM
jgi:hypothetical protein